MPADTLSATFAALADPTRRAILARLTGGEISVSELAEPFHMTMPAVTKHLKVLERAGLIARTREAQWRPCSLRAAPLQEAAGWIDSYRQHWEQRLDRLEAYLQKLQSEQVQGKAQKKRQRETKSAAPSTTAARDGRAKRPTSNKQRVPKSKRSVPFQ